MKLELETYKFQLDSSQAELTKYNQYVSDLESQLRTRQNQISEQNEKLDAKEDILRKELEGKNFQENSLSRLQQTKDSLTRVKETLRKNVTFSVGLNLKKGDSNTGQETSANEEVKENSHSILIYPSFRLNPIPVNKPGLFYNTGEKFAINFHESEDNPKKEFFEWTFKNSKKG